MLEQSQTVIVKNQSLFILYVVVVAAIFLPARESRSIKISGEPGVPIMLIEGLQKEQGLPALHLLDHLLGKINESHTNVLLPFHFYPLRMTNAYYTKVFNHRNQVFLEIKPFLKRQCFLRPEHFRKECK